ncbi:uncharacterized protein K444DRAFT_627803 [Hyaloscypha bicolor E]|uniref:Uncharacterized protein n=1 Tax=Hyaloscypha bicolor E TaxID=1095630 RepID=A0A2J6TIW2_9HELO|nr:uncharacterized protein K444DRAFT_627803 [Hyaloscypha bicolor E]PMD62943.1 hypothetical protein K444DRAFT_627803 [Hyaloscypha bicolor E]
MQKPGPRDDEPLFDLNQHTLPPYQPPYLPSQALSAVPLLSIKQALSPLVMGSVKEEKGALDYFPCMSVDGQKHLHARMWSTSLPSSTPTGIALRGRGFWKGLPVVSFGGRAIALDYVNAPNGWDQITGGEVPVDTYSKDQEPSKWLVYGYGTGKLCGWDKCSVLPPPWWYQPGLDYILA